MLARSQLALLVLGYLCLDTVNGQASTDRALHGHHLKFMTFNTWNNGSHVDDGMKKIARHIQHNNPDIVALQEIMKRSVLPDLVKLLEGHWTYVIRNDSTPHTAVLTRHEIVSATTDEYTSVGAKVKVTFQDGTVRLVNVWSAYLDWRQYGPYAPCNKSLTNVLRQLEAGERNEGGKVPGRVQNIEQILGYPKFREALEQTDDQLLLVAGDFNSPSHLDWIDSTKDKHCNFTYQWPVSTKMYAAGMKDAFRQVHPDPGAVPGDTWSPIYKFTDGKDHGPPEPQDRIDYIYYKGDKWSPVSAEVYHGDKPIQILPNVRGNDWPSDHSTVIATFKLNHMLRT